MRPGEDDFQQRVFADSGNDAALVVMSGPRGGETIALLPGNTTMGRQPDNDVVLEEGAVSRQHAVIVGTDQGYHLRDLESTNGAFLNDQKIDEGEHILKHGDVIRLGGSNVSFMFQQNQTMTIKLAAVGPVASASIVIDAKARQVWVDGRLVDPPLARKEFDLLALLDSRRTEAVSRDDIAKNVWPERPDGNVGNYEIEQCVHRTRVRVEENPSDPKFLVTMRGFGYKLL